MLGMIKPIHPERPAINSPHLCWDEIASKIAKKKLRFDGSREDYWTYLHALEETFVRAGTGLATKIGLDSYVRVPPVYAQYMNVRYWRLLPAADFYHFVPVEPNPPSPLEVTDSSVDAASSALATCANTS